MIKNAEIVGANVPPERYQSEDKPRGHPEYFVRSHVLTEVLRNSQRWVRGYVSPETKAKKWGSLWDCYLLTPDQYRFRYAVVPPDAPKKPSKTQIHAKEPSKSTLEAIAWWKQFKAAYPGEIIDAKQDENVRVAVSRLREDKLIADLIDTSAHQVMVVAEWHDQSGLVVPMKCLIDILPPADHPVLFNSIWDTKSTRNASPRSFSRDAQSYGYAVQGAFYLDMFNAASGQPARTDFGHVVQENYAPYEYRTPPPLMTQRFLDHGRLLYQRALGIYCASLQSGVWPGYDAPAQGWPLTDCEDWYLSMHTLYDEMSEPEIEETPRTEDDLIP